MQAKRQSLKDPRTQPLTRWRYAASVADVIALLVSALLWQLACSVPPNLLGCADHRSTLFPSLQDDLYGEVDLYGSGYGQTYDDDQAGAYQHSSLGAQVCTLQCSPAPPARPATHASNQGRALLLSLQASRLLSTNTSLGGGLDRAASRQAVHSKHACGVPSRRQLASYTWSSPGWRSWMQHLRHVALA